MCFPFFQNSNDLFCPKFVDSQSDETLQTNQSVEIDIKTIVCSKSFDASINQQFLDAMGIFAKF